MKMKARSSANNATKRETIVSTNARVNPMEDTGIAGFDIWTKAMVMHTAIKARKRKDSARIVVFFDPPERRQERKASKQSWAVTSIGTFTAKLTEVTPRGS